MILTDTSVMVAHTRTPNLTRQQIIVQHAPFTCGVATSEFWAGAYTPQRVAQCQSLLAQMRFISTPDHLWQVAGLNQVLLRGRGLTVPLSDTTIATVAIHYGYELWAYDKHFVDMAAILPGLTLYAEPP